MSCRHAPGDPNCSSTIGGPIWAQLQKEKHEKREKELIEKEKEILARTPNPNSFTILDHQQVGIHLVLKVQYSSCDKCSFDSAKVMVFHNTKVGEALYWKTIDPHFSEKKTKVKTQSPPPRARFPADKEGWEDAIKYAKGKQDVSV